ncbi:hypothetical protein AXF42_Ash018409 [Apostasia shenzhenica]|uniref:R3H domain-containing protein n=1 Tax=Apostasia shenzhenica TaxID=1088818 RepID=A0A2I0BE97_9ASPA|nr:hypothetical protein AXF42_Ash018409 [Apostasia shenzhenica]
MTITQLAMVEELASLIKDNLYCKHLVLSTEEELINFLQNDSSTEAVLELQPMSPYERLLLHRLADIYGFAHQSVGEGELRHLVLERCPETAIPPLLVGDILWQYDEYQSPSPPHIILRRKEASETKVVKTIPSSTPLEVREAAYLAARERIFSIQDDNQKEIPPRSRKVPEVAQRMIAHALGQKVSSLRKCDVNDKANDPTVCTLNDTIEATEILQSSKPVSHQKKRTGKLSAKYRKSDGSSEPEGNTSSGAASNERTAGSNNLEKEQMGAAKRIFAQALGRASGNQSRVPVRADENCNSLDR